MKNSSTVTISATGVSRMASNAGEKKKSRTVRRSLKACCEPSGDWLARASNTAWKTRGRRASSNFRPASCITCERAHSSTSSSM